MFDLDLEKTIQMLVDKELDRSKPVIILDDGKCQRPGVYLTILLDVQDYDRRVQKFKCVHMLFFGNTSVFYAIGQDTIIENVPVHHWINTSNHDSCWRSDGFAFLFNLKMKMCKEVNPNAKPIDLYTKASFLFSSCYPIHHCTVTYTCSSHRYHIVDIKK